MKAVNIFMKGRILIFTLSLILFIGLTGSSCLSNRAPEYQKIESDNEYHIQMEWSYKSKRWRYETDIPITIYEHFAQEPRSNNYSEYAVNDIDDEWLGYTAKSFKEISTLEGWNYGDTINFVLSFVQSIEYSYDIDTAGYDEYPRYPIETIVDGTGDCEDTVVMFISILREMGYDVALLLYADDEHMAAGVSIPQDLVVSWNQGYELTHIVSPEGESYAYCDTTYAGWRLGEKPDKITGSVQMLEID